MFRLHSTLILVDFCFVTLSSMFAGCLCRSFSAFVPSSDRYHLGIRVSHHSQTSEICSLAALLSVLDIISLDPEWTNSTTLETRTIAVTYDSHCVWESATHMTLWLVKSKGHGLHTATYSQIKKTHAESCFRLHSSTGLLAIGSNQLTCFFDF